MVCYKVHISQRMPPESLPCQAAPHQAWSRTLQTNPSRSTSTSHDHLSTSAPIHSSVASCAWPRLFPLHPGHLFVTFSLASRRRTFTSAIPLTKESLSTTELADWTGACGRAFAWALASSKAEAGEQILITMKEAEHNDLRAGNASKSTLSKTEKGFETRS